MENKKANQRWAHWSQWPQWSRKLAWTLGVIAGVIILLAVFGVKLATCVVGKVQPQRVKAELSLEEELVRDLLVAKLNKQVVEPYENAERQEPVVMELTKEETNLLLADTIRTYQVKYSKPGDVVLFCEFKDGKIWLYVSCPLNIGQGGLALQLRRALYVRQGMKSWRNAKEMPLAINGRCSVIPNVANGKLHLDVENLHVGDLWLPGDVIELIIARELAKVENTQEYRGVMEAIQSLKINDAGNFEMTIIPEYASYLTMMLR